MRKVLEKALKNLIGEDFELNKIVYQKVNEDNINEILKDIGFTRVSVFGSAKETLPDNETRITERFVFIDIDRQRFFTSEEISEVNGDYIVLRNTVEPIRAVTFVKPTGPSRELTKGLRKKIISAMK